MSMPPLSSETKKRISTIAAKKPPFNVDPNVGKSAKPISGVYAGLYGILYPLQHRMSYIANYVPIVGGSDKQYLLLFFYDDGKLFCGIEVNKDEIEVLGGYEEPPQGNGTFADPFISGSHDIRTITSTRYYHKIRPREDGYGGTIFVKYYRTKGYRISVYDAANQDVPLGSDIVTSTVFGQYGRIDVDYYPIYGPHTLVVEVERLLPVDESEVFGYSVGDPWRPR
ncbi:hypothetical protein [Pseudobacillus badius]|uniref:hypothetical protein n=1 Tax=Bacillus badius TaxID=1455 RepID=UPI0007B35934|nr:hypothetical protein [Bacillus badius]KZR57533.1 hypothetical protein A3781_19770 [Bacillus badius]